MTSLINDILMISRLEANEIKESPTTVDLQKLLSEILITLEPLTKELEITISVNCPPVTIEAIPQQMHQLCLNLLTNAVKYNHPGGRVQVNVHKAQKNIVLTVQDNGAGIPKEAQERIFERFYRVDKSRSRKQGGTGLGLSIVKHIVNHAQGTIELTSAPGKGSCFTITLPIRTSQIPKAGFLPIKTNHAFSYRSSISPDIRSGFSLSSADTNKNFRILNKTAMAIIPINVSIIGI